MSDCHGDPTPRKAARTVIFGGTFDPVHLGHLFAAEEVMDRFDYERVIFVPAHLPPHKSEGPVVSPAARLEMLNLAIGDHSRFGLESLEIDRGGVSFTIDTIRYFVESGSLTGRPGLVVGADLIDGFETWREVDDIERLADIILVRRPGFSGGRFHRRHRTIDNLELGVSSRELRARIRAGRPYQFLLPQKVVEYIELNGLYR